jgi:hypothetical protein
MGKWHFSGTQAPIRHQNAAATRSNRTNLRNLSRFLPKWSAFVLLCIWRNGNATLRFGNNRLFAGAVCPVETMSVPPARILLYIQIATTTPR